MLFRDADTEDAQFGHFSDHIQRDQGIRQMPAMRMRRDAFAGEGAKLVADHVERVVTRALVRAFSIGQPAREFCPVFRRVSRADEMAGRIARSKRKGFLLQAVIGRAYDLALAHRHAAENLGAIFPHADIEDEPFDVAKGICLPRAVRPVAQGVKRFSLRGDPCIAVKPVLLALGKCGIDFAAG